MRLFQALVVADSAQTTGVKWAAPGYPTFSGCQLVLTSDYTLATATTYTVAWTTETYDTDNYHDNSTNNTRITIPTTGYYRLTGATVLSATGSQTLVRFTKNGSDFKHNAEEGSIYSYAFGHCFATGYFAANDYLEMSVRHDKGSNATVFSGSYYTWFAIERLG